MKIKFVAAVITSFVLLALLNFNYSFAHTETLAVEPSPHASLLATPSPNLLSRAISSKQKSDEVTLLMQKVQTANSELKKYTKHPSVVSIAQKRQELMKFLAEKDAKRFLAVTLDDSVRVSLLPEAQKYVEKYSVTTGQLKVVHVDDFKNHDNSRFIFSLNVNQKNYKIYTPVTLSAKRGGPVQVRGFNLDDIVVLESGDPSVIPLAAQDSLDALGNQRTLALIVETPSSKSTVTVAEVEKALFDPLSPFEQFFKNQSYGKTWFTGKAYKISLKRDIAEGTCYTGGSGISMYDVDVVMALKNNNISLDNIDRIIFIANIYGGCSDVGKGTSAIIDGKTYKFSEFRVGWNDMRDSIDHDYIQYIVAHEMGHSLGVYHANSLVCEEGDACKHREYGNYFDVMGSGPGDYNALYKEQLHWLTPSDFLNITKTGNYTINGIENKSGYRAAKVVNPNIGPQSLMYLESRFKDVSGNTGTLGLAEGQRFGLLLNVPQNSSDLRTTAPELIDMTPGNPRFGERDDLELVALREGAQSFTPNSSGITLSGVKVANKTDNGSINFNVALSKPNCISRPPQIETSGFTYKAVPGESVNIHTTFSNVDTSWCFGPSDFVMKITQLPDGWSVNGVNPTLPKTIPTGSLAFFDIDIHVPNDVRADRYPIDYQVTNIKSGVKAGYRIWVDAVQGPQISIDRPSVNAGDTLSIKTNYSGGEYVNVTADGKDIARLFYGKILGDGTINVPIPAVLDSSNSYCSKEFPCPRPLPSGLYYISINYLGQDSNRVSIVINSADSKDQGNISFTSKPTLSLNYDQSRRESGLIASFPITLSAGAKDLYFYYDSGSIIFNNTNKRVFPTDQTFSWEINTVSLSGLVPQTDKKNRSFFLIPAGQKFNFNITANVKPASMAPGTYWASLNDLSIRNENDANVAPAIPLDKTNYVTIVGETGPYVIDVTGEGTICNAITIKGIRFSPFNNVITLTTDDGLLKKEVKNVPSQDSGTTIRFLPYGVGVKPGRYYLTVTNMDKGEVYGKSNTGNSVSINSLAQACVGATPFPVTTVDPQPILKDPGKTIFEQAIPTSLPTVITTPTPTYTPVTTTSVVPIQTTTQTPSQTIAPAASVSSTPAPTSTATPTTYSSPSSSPLNSSSASPSSSASANIYRASLWDAIKGVFGF